MSGTERKTPELETNISSEVVGLSEFDPNALSHVVTGAEFEHRRLPGGGSSINLLHCTLPNAVINRGIYSPAVLVNGTFAPTAITIGTMLRQKEPTILNGANVRMGTIQFYAEKSEMSYRAWPNATWLAFVISRERLTKFCTDHFDEMPELPKAGIATIEPKSQGSGDQFLDRLRDLDRSLRCLGSLPNAGRLGESVENDLLARIATFISGSSAMRREDDRRRLRKCDEILRDTMKQIEEDPNDMLDLRSMSKATGLSPRTLQRTFQAEYGLCPQEWVRFERLNRVRRDLLNPRQNTSVTQVATRWGFFHLSRFSQYYRELFGERPSETLSRSMTA
jgi:AraC-like DNA-binding protein